MKKTLIFLTAFLAASTAIADDAEKPDLSSALSVSPIHLLSPMVEIQGEQALGKIFSLALIAGAGQITTTETIGQPIKFNIYEVGCQLRAYFAGNFEEGAYAGIETLQIWVEGNSEGVRGLGEGLEMGAIAGYKWGFHRGFFIELNGGVGFLMSSANAEEVGGTQEAHLEESRFIPILNFNLGWAF